MKNNRSDVRRRSILPKETVAMKKTTKVAGTIAICATIIVLGFAAYVIARNQAQENVGTDATTAVKNSVILQISEDKRGWGIDGQPLPSQHREKELTVTEGSRIYEGLKKKEGDSSRCILTITGISEDTITVEMLEDGQETVKDISYNKELQFTAYTNPDEYSYVFTIKFVK